MNRSIRAYSTTHDKFLLLLIANISCTSLMGMQNQITPINNDALQEQVASMAHDRHERIPNDPEHIQLHAGMEQIKQSSHTSPDSTLKTAASLLILANDKTTLLPSVNSAARMEDQAPRRRSRRPQISCPTSDECSTMCCEGCISTIGAPFLGCVFSVFSIPKDTCCLPCDLSHNKCCPTTKEICGTFCAFYLDMCGVNCRKK